MATDGNTTLCYAPQSDPPTHYGSERASPSKKRKSGLGSVLRRLFSRRKIKSQTSAPAPTGSHHVRSVLDTEDGVVDHPA